MDSIEWYLEQYLDRAVDVANAYAFPLRARSLSGLPSATVLTAGFDPLRDEGAAYADRLESAGVDVEHHRYEGQIHAFCSLYEHIDEGRTAIVNAATRLEDGLSE